MATNSIKQVRINMIINKDISKNVLDVDSNNFPEILLTKSSIVSAVKRPIRVETVFV
jgi:hypothetical protein